MMKLVSHAPVDAAADQVECVAGIVTLTNNTTYVSLRKICFILIVDWLTLPLLLINPQHRLQESYILLQRFGLSEFG